VGGFEPLTGGELRVRGAPVQGPGPDRGVIFQEFALYPWRTVADNVTWALEIQGRPRAERREVADRLLAMVGLTKFREHYPAELSGGMKQRVAIARTLAYDPAILLMDEPFGALDAQNRELMQEELQGIWNQTRKTVLFITHDIDEAIYLADRVVLMTNGPNAVLAEIVENPLPKERKRTDFHKHPLYYGVRNHIIDFLVSRSRNFAEDMKVGNYDRRRVPVVRPGAPEPVVAAETTAPVTPTWPGLAQNRA
jgi:ABC-type nitrate/sulfonate/bicarbonate transport system ATPase subunit